MSSANDISYRASATSSAKRALPNVSSGWVVMLLSGLLAMVIFFVLAGSSAKGHTVTVIGRHVEPGEPITSGMLRQAEVDVNSEQLGRMVTFDNRSSIEGWIATAPMEPGDIVMKSAVRQPATNDGRRSMSIPVDRAHAVDGELRSGDRIDVIDASVTPAAYVAQGVEVLSVNSSSGGGLGGNSAFSLTVAVDEQTAVKLSSTIKNAKFDIIRSTGATPPAAANANTNNAGNTTSTTAAP